MKKNIVQDVVPPKKSIRNVKISSKKEIFKASKPNISDDYSEALEMEKDEFSRPVPIREAPIRIEPVKKEEPNDAFAYKYEYTEAKKSSKKWLYVSFTLLILAVAFGISAFFKSATIKITPKQQTASINKSFVAKKDSVTGLGYQVVTVTKEVEQTEKATGEERVERKAQGRIVIYNNFSKDSVKLVATTRFQTPEGLIFRLVNPVTVPGTFIKDNKTVPGQIEVTVEADKAGVSYNIGLKDFTIPGFKGTPKYTAIFARSKSEMTGGFSGMQKTVSNDVLNRVESEMGSKLKTDLQNDIKAQIPSNFVSFSDALNYELEKIIPINSTNSDSVVLRKKGKATAIIFDRGVLTKAIESSALPETESGSIKITNLDSLKYKQTNSNQITDNQISFNLEGEAVFVWEVNENSLKTDLLGLSKKSAMTVLAKYTGVSEAWIETKPFWNQKIPSNPDKVTIINAFSGQ